MDKSKFKIELDKLYKQLFGKELVTEKFEDVTLADESAIRIEPTIEVGATVTVETEGEYVPVPDNSYELANGTIIVVKDGVIESIEEAQEEGEEMGSADSEKELADLMAVIDSLFGEFKKELDDSKKDLATVKSEFEAYKKTVTKDSEDLKKSVFEAVKSIGNEPQEAPPKKKGGFRIEKKVNKFLKK